jgi:hypothetical protein
VEEVFDSALIPDEPEALVNQQACDRPGRHNPCPPMNDTPDIPGSLTSSVQEQMGRKDAARQKAPGKRRRPANLSRPHPRRVGPQRRR